VLSHRLLAAAAAAQPPDASHDAGIRLATLTLFLIALLTVLLLAVMLAIALYRHRRRHMQQLQHQKQTTDQAPLADPWEEAGRRARPYDTRPPSQS